MRKKILLILKRFQKEISLMELKYSKYTDHCFLQLWINSRDALRRVEKTPKVLILRMRHVLALDATGLKALEDLLKKMKKDKSVLILSGIHAQPFVVMDQAGFLDKIGKDNVQADIDTALERARIIFSWRSAYNQPKLKAGLMARLL